MSLLVILLKLRIGVLLLPQILTLNLQQQIICKDWNKNLLHDQFLQLIVAKMMPCNDSVFNICDTILHHQLALLALTNEIKIVSTI